MKKNNLAGHTYAPTAPFDWVAVEHLQFLIRSFQDKPFKLVAAEFAQEKSLEVLNRKASGVQLAKDLFRDGKRYATRFNCFRWLENEDAIQQIDGPSFDYSADNLAKTTSLVISCLNLLTSIEKSALLIALRGERNDEALVRRELGVGTRQFRNILKAITMKVQKQPETREAFCFAINVFGFTTKDFVKILEEGAI